MKRGRYGGEQLSTVADRHRPQLPKRLRWDTTFTRDPPLLHSYTTAEDSDLVMSWADPR